MQKQFIPKRKVHQTAPLSFAQQRLWFLDQLEPNSSRYNVSRALKLRGELNLIVLQEAIDAIVSRHETLRSNFREVDGLPTLITRPSMKTPMTFVDLSDQPIDCRENTLIATLNEQVLRPYNLSTDAMLRATLVRLTRHDHILLLVLPHITSDGWSMVILGQELMALYDSLLHGQPCPFPDLPIQY
ncbi:MAG: condensation domain-containing protein, partial [Candidatus Binatia bacterium]